MSYEAGGAPPCRARVQDRGDGRWFFQASRGRDPVTGRRKRLSKLFHAATREEAQAMADAWLASVMGHKTVNEAVSAYIDTKEAMHRVVNTARTYRTLLACYIAPFIGHMFMDEVTAINIQTLYVELMRRGGRDGEPLAPATVIGVHNLLSGAYRYCVHMGICDSSPMADVEPPEPEDVTATPLDQQALQGMTEWICARLDPESADAEDATEDARREHVAALAFWVALHTGMRVGEVCALRWCDVQSEARTVRVMGTIVEPQGGGLIRQTHTKGKKARKVTVGASLMDALVAEYRWQCEHIAVRKATPVVSLDGEYTDPGNLSRWFRWLCAELGVEGDVTFHSLRHTHATYLLANGVSIRTVSERLGHAKPSTTVNVYAHVLPGSDEVAAQVFDDIVNRRMEPILPLSGLA